MPSSLRKRRRDQREYDDQRKSGLHGWLASMAVRSAVLVVAVTAVLVCTTRMRKGYHAEAEGNQERGDFHVVSSRQTAQRHRLIPRPFEHHPFV